ncbi:MAG: GlsB/YeaQ/YmgE family stress response membrane protein [Candidatus Peribacteraceae bacterium]|nr:GlsB/YeaQ/YmgE family stress response membrane protein [Candidatus Peribacteraceae bacterium]
MSILGFIVIGIIAGWIAGIIMRGHGFGLIADLVIGIVGAVIGGFLFRMFGITAYGSLGALAMAVLGSVVFLGLAGVVKRA